MNTLDSPLEALAFNYLSFGFLTAVNNIWTWVAVITAAISFWKIRAAGSTTGATMVSLPRDRNPVLRPPPMVSSPPVTEEVVADQPADSATTAMRISPWIRAVETTEGTTSGKFTVYYEDEASDQGELTLTGGDVDDDGVGGFGVVVNGGVEEWCDVWKRTLRMRMGDTEWYCYQDSTMLDGNVVRLWDSSEQKATYDLILR